MPAVLAANSWALRAVWSCSGAVAIALWQSASYLQAVEDLAVPQLIARHGSAAANIHRAVYRELHHGPPRKCNGGISSLPNWVRFENCSWRDHAMIRVVIIWPVFAADVCAAVHRGRRHSRR